jgi:hypothetical protein
MKREGAKTIASVALTGALIGCQKLGWNTGSTLYSASWVLNVFGPEAPIIVGAIGGGVVDVFCMVGALWTYRSAIQVIEGDFLIDKAGCGC